MVLGAALMMLPVAGSCGQTPAAPYGLMCELMGQPGLTQIVDPRPWVTGTISDTFVAYPKIGPLLPAMGYSEKQIADLRATIDRVECDLVLIGTPIDLSRLMAVNKPTLRVSYDLEEKGDIRLAPEIDRVLAVKRGHRRRAS